MLSKLGWTQGQALGKTQSGIIEPVPIQSNEGTKGLGCEDIVVIVDKKTAKKNRQLQITKERYNKATPADVFKNSSDESD